MEWNIVKQAFEDMKTHHESEIPKLRTEINKTTERELTELSKEKGRQRYNQFRNEE